MAAFGRCYPRLMSTHTEPASASSPSSAGPDPLIGKVIDGCRMVRKIGQGGMGVVYLARHESLGQDFCIKILNPSLVGSEDTVERFFREAQACAQLNHPAIVAIQNVGQEGEYYFIRMEYIDGYTLEEVVRQQEKMDWRKATEHVLSTAEALAHAHQKGMIHRDIKPENIMLTQKGELKVMDFGLAKHVHSSAKVSVTGQIVGTPFFMSPEQAGGKPTDARSDIYSLGVTLYYLVTGVKPFNGKNLQEIFLKHFFYAPESPKIYNPALPESLCEIVRKCLKKKKKERYQSAKALAKDLRAVLDDPEAKVGDEGGAAVATAGGADDDASGDGELDKTVRATPGADDGERTVRVGGASEGEGDEGRTVRVSDDGGGATVAVKPGEDANKGKRKKDVAQVSFRSASMVLDPNAVEEKLEIDDEEDDPTAGIDLPTMNLPGQSPGDAGQDQALAELQRAPVDKKKLAAIGLLVLIPVLLYAGLVFASQAKLASLERQYEEQRGSQDPAVLRALAAEIDQFLASNWAPSVGEKATALRDVCNQTADSAEKAKLESEKLAAERQKQEEERQKRLAEQAAKVAQAKQDLAALDDLKAKEDWRLYAELGRQIHKDYQDLPDVADRIGALRLPVVVTSDPPGAEIYVNDEPAAQGQTPPLGKGVVWAPPASVVNIKVALRGFESASFKGDTREGFLSFEARLKRSLQREIDLGTVKALIGNRQVDEPLIPVGEPQLDGARGGTLYFVGHDGALRGISLQARGSQVWAPGETHKVGMYGDPTPAAKLVPGKVLIVPSLTGAVSAHDPSNGGQRIWTAALGAPVTSPPAYSQANQVIAVGLDTGGVSFLSDQTGHELWRFETENKVTSAPFFLGQSLVFVGSADNRLYALDWQARRELGRIDLWADVTVGPLPFGRHLVVGTGDGSVWVVDPLEPQNLRSVARVQPGPAGASVRGLAVEGDAIYFSAGTELRAVRVSKDGQVKEEWERPYVSPTPLTPPTFADGVVYVGAQDGALTALDARNGEVLWRQRTQGRGGIRQPVMVIDNELFVVSGNTVLVFKAD